MAHFLGVATLTLIAAAVVVLILGFAWYLIPCYWVLWTFAWYTGEILAVGRNRRDRS